MAAAKVPTHSPVSLMIDFNFDGGGRGQSTRRNVLVLSPTVDSLIPASMNFLELIQPNFENTVYLNFDHVFEESGPGGCEALIEETARRERIDIVFFTDAFLHQISINFVENLRRNYFVVMMLNDNALWFDQWYRYISQGADLVLTHDYTYKGCYEMYGIQAAFVFPYHDSHSAIFRKHAQLNDKDIQVSHVGRLDRIGRDQYLTELATSGISVECFGVGTSNGPLSFSDMVDVFCRSKIGINFSGVAHYRQNKQIGLIEKKERQIKGRLWELSFAKAMILSEPAPYLDRYFESDREYVEFNDSKELTDKLKYFLTHDKEREEIALAAYNRSVRDFGLESLPAKYMKIIEHHFSIKKYRPRSIVLDEIFLSEKSKKEARALARMIGGGRLGPSLGTMRELISTPRHLSGAAENFSREYLKSFLAGKPLMSGAVGGLRRAVGALRRPGP